MMDFLAKTILLASMSVFIFIVLEKWGAITYLQLHATRIFGRFNKLPGCIFCMLFWICFLASIPLIISNIFYIALPFASAPIARAIYANCNSPRI
jgi:hypothetical protein